MKFLVICTFAVIFLANFAASADVDPESEQDGGRVLHRVRRFTCDVLSFEAGSIKLNHAACALHCVQLGKAGGYCNSQAVCVCRN